MLSGIGRGNELMETGIGVTRGMEGEEPFWPDKLPNCLHKGLLLSYVSHRRDPVLARKAVKGAQSIKKRVESFVNHAYGWCPN